MKLAELNCPTCGHPAPKDLLPGKQFQCPACQSILVLTDPETADVIICPQCGLINPEGTQHCGSCGESLTITCPYCDSKNEVGSENCDRCGVNLTHATERKRQWLEETRRLAQERFEAGKAAEQRDKVQRLNRLLSELDEPENHNMAIYSLTQMGNYALPSLLHTLEEDEDPDARFGAAIALGQLANPKALPSLTRALQDYDASVRYWSIDALEKLGNTSTLEVLQDCLKDKHKGVRERARRAILALGGELKSGWWPFG